MSILYKLILVDDEEEVRKGILEKIEWNKYGFEIAGEDRKFVPTVATISGKTVVVRSMEVPHPVAVRYSWADDPRCSLYGKSGLPAYPFRTDDWPGVTEGKK